MPKKKSLQADQPAPVASVATIEPPSGERLRPVASVATIEPPSEPVAIAPLPAALGGGVLGDPFATKRPEAFTKIVAEQQTRLPNDSLAGITTALGASLWTTNKRFEWARAANRHHYDFTRYYFQQSVLVDVFPNANASTRKEADERGKCIAAQNERGGRPIGYLAVVKGAQIPPEAFTAVLAGAVLPLVERATEGVLA
jgi:hypothetical protein